MKFFIVAFTTVACEHKLEIASPEGPDADSADNEASAPSPVSPHHPHTTDTGIVTDTGSCDYNLILSGELHGTYCEGLGEPAADMEEGLAQIQDSTELYYVLNDQRHLVTDGAVLESWWGVDACSVCPTVTPVTQDLVSSLLLGTRLTLKPGAFIIKIETDDTLFLVDKCATAREADQMTLGDLYGEGWQNLVRTLSDSVFGDYAIGTPVPEASAFDLEAALATSLADELACP